MTNENKRGTGNTTRVMVEVIHSLIVNDKSCVVVVMNPHSYDEYAKMICDHLAPFVSGRLKLNGRTIEIESIRLKQKLTVEVRKPESHTRALGDRYTLIFDG